MGQSPLPSSFSDTGAEWIEFAFANDNVVELTLTDTNRRFWLGDGPPGLAITLSDTGWSDGEHPLANPSHSR